MTRKTMTRAQQDASLRVVVRGMPVSGYTPNQMAVALNGCLENTRVLMQRLAKQGVLKGDGALRGQIFYRTDNWEDRLDEYFAVRNAHMREVLARSNRTRVCQLGDGTPIVAHAIKHQPTSVWALGSRAYAS